MISGVPVLGRVLRGELDFPLSSRSWTLEFGMADRGREPMDTPIPKHHTYSFLGPQRDMAL